MNRALFNRNLWNLVRKTALKSPITGQAVRHSGHAVFYRTAPTVHPVAKVGAEVVSAVMWWWIFWHLWHEYEHVTGEFEYPDTTAWSNKELGIPADA